MTLAIRGDRASCLSLPLGARSWLLAVARGFGCVGALSTESAVLARLRSECLRRARSRRFRRAIDRPHSAADAMLGILSRVNADLYACTASHEDYVTAAASLTAVLVVQRRALVMHAGSTGAYLAHDGDVLALSGDDTFDACGTPLLFRVLGAGPVLDVTVSSASLAPGDAIVLLGHSLRSRSELLALLAQLKGAADPGPHVLVARFEGDDPLAGDIETIDPAALPSAKLAWLGRVTAALGFLIATVCTH